MSNHNEVKRSIKILQVLNQAIGKEIPSLHKSLMMIQKFRAKLIEAERGKVNLEFRILPEMVNPLGLLHGGIQCVILDDSMAIAAATLGNNKFSITLNLQINYLGKAKLDELIRVRAQVIKEGHSIIHINSNIKKLNGDLIASAKSDLVITKISRDYSKNIEGGN